MAAAAFLAHYMIFDRPGIRKEGVGRRDISRGEQTPTPKTPLPAKPKFEIYPKEVLPPDEPVPEPEIPPEMQLPKVAIIIDDMGYDRKMADRFLSLDAVLTFSFLPQSPFLRTIVTKAHRNGFETMLHQPMEPMEYPEVDPGPGALLTTMSPDELTRQLNKNLDAFPYIKGVNNHMGSKMTTISTQMYQVFIVLKKRNLFFIDSRTSAQTLCKPSARLMQVPFAERDVFLDHVQSQTFVRNQFRRLLHRAIDQGYAVGIAHPHPVTYEVLQELLPDLKKKVRLVPASEVVHIIG